MLSEKGYETLQLILADRTNEIRDFNTFGYLEHKGYIAYTGPGYAYVTPRGEEACKKYELKLDAKNYAEKANKLAKLSLILSLIISVSSLVVSIMVAILK